MKTLLVLCAITTLAAALNGCSAGASVGHDGHRHGVGVSGTTSGPGVSAGARAY